MIQEHKFPSRFDGRVGVVVSSRSDGTMLDRTKSFDDPRVVANRKRFLDLQSIAYENVAIMKISYSEHATFDVVSEAYRDMPVADSTITDEQGLSVMLPIADCTAAVVYDSRHHALGVLHMGRHSTIADLVPVAIGRMAKEFGTSPKDLSAWLSPSVKKESYVMKYFDEKNSPRWQDFSYESADGIHLDIPGRVRQDFLDLGVTAEDIVTSPIDTTIDKNYFSHQSGDTTRRFAVVATLLRR